MNDYSLLEKTPLSYKKEKQDCKYTTIDACTNSCELYQTVNIKSVLQSVSAPQTVQYGGRDMVIQKAVAADKSGAMRVTFYLQLADKVEEEKSYILGNLKIHSYQNEIFFKTTSNSTIVLLQEAILEA